MHHVSKLMAQQVSADLCTGRVAAGAECQYWPLRVCISASRVWLTRRRLVVMDADVSKVVAKQLLHRSSGALVESVGCVTPGWCTRHWIGTDWWGGQLCQRPHRR